MEILKVSTKSNPNLVAGALVNILKEKEKPNYIWVYSKIITNRDNFMKKWVEH